MFKEKVNYKRIFLINKSDENMESKKKSVLLVSMPFTEIITPSIQLSVLEGYLKERNIKVQTRHLYLKAAEFYGIKNYLFLTNSPKNSHQAQMAFSRYAFPEHWTTTEDKSKNYFNEKIWKNPENQKTFTFDYYLQQTERFYNWVLEHVDWISYDIIGFEVNPEQLLPSLAIAKKIKEQYPEKIIIFAGSQTASQLGVNVLRAFDYVDFTISGDCEEALYRLATDFQNYDSIPHLIYRVGNDVIWNQPDTYIELDTLPIPNFDSFYAKLKQGSKEVQEFFKSNGKLPVEISRGCWWNKCTFCNINIQHPCYREKSVKRIVEEMKFLSDKYSMCRFKLIGKTLPKKDSRLLFEEIIKLGIDLDLYADVLPGQLQSDDYRLIKKAGFNNIHLSVFSFNQNFLKKMNTGTRVIDNVAALKFCKENGIRALYDLLVNYPNEEDVDVEETKKTLDEIKAWDLDLPQQFTSFVIQFGSIIYNNLQQHSS
jgi:ribosomal peptide maturation radical SAM protein 1